MMGMHGEAWVNKAIQDADLLLAFGMRFDDRVTGSLKTYAQNAKKIHIDIDPAEINKNVKVDVALVGDLRQILHELMPRIEMQDRREWVTHVVGLKGDSAVRDIQNLPDNGHLYAAHVINDLWHETRDRDAIIVTDVGQHQMWEAQYYKHERPRSLITSGGLGTMGFALPAGIGAKVGCPNSDVWVMPGDGGFQMTLCELATIVQEGLKVNIAIINNGYLGMVRQWQEFFYDRNYEATPLLSPNFVKLGEAYGIRSIAVKRREDVIPAVRAAHAHTGPMLIDFQVEQEDTVYPMVAAGAALHEMIRRPNPLEETASDE
jgi:acetolactate synthase-1/2/3 large subunit